MSQIHEPHDNQIDDLAHLRQYIAQLEQENVALRAEIAQLHQHNNTDTSLHALRQRMAELEQQNHEHQACERQIQTYETIVEQTKTRILKAFHANPLPLTIMRIADGCLVDVNQKFTELTGYTYEELIGHGIDLALLVDPDDYPRVLDTLQEQHTMHSIDVRIRTRAGEIRDVSAAATLIDLGGESGILSVLNDVTEYKQAEAALYASEARYRQIVETAAEGIWIIDTRGIITFVNSTLTHMLGYSVAEMIGQPFLSFVPTDSQQYATETLQHCCMGYHEQREFKLQRHDGSWLWVLMSTAPTTDRTGSATGILAMVTDMTTRRRLEDALRNRVALTRLIMTISTRFIHLDLEDIDSEIIASLHKIGSFISTDCATLTFFDEQVRTAAIIFRWCNQDMPPPANLDSTSWSSDPLITTEWSLRQLQQGHVVAVHRICDLPAEAHMEQAMLRTLGVQSYVVAPMICGDRLVGSLGLNMVYSERHWSEDIISLLRVVGEIFANAITRKRAEEALRRSHNDLEERVAQRTVELTRSNRLLQQHIHEHEQTAHALAESEERYRTLVETSPSAILLADMQCVIQFCNRQAVQLFGYTSVDEIIHRKGTDLLPPDLEQQHKQYIQQIITTDTVRNTESVMCRSDGSRFPVEMSSSVITDPHGNPNGLIIVVHDISERKQAEQALTQANAYLAALNENLSRSRNLLRAIFDGLDDGLVLLDSANTVQIINQALVALLGSPPDELHGQSWPLLVERITRRSTLESLPTSSLTPPGKLQRLRYAHTDGTIRVFDIHTIPLYSDRHTVEHTIVHVVDVTHQVQLQARIIENERSAASGRLAARVAHEINTPLQSLQAALETMQIAPEHERSLFQTHALAEIQRVGRIVHQLLDIYRPAAHRGMVDLNILMERILLMNDKRIKRQQVRVERDLERTLPALEGRADELMQVLLNLVANALDSMPDGGVLTVGSRIQRHWETRAVADTARGAHLADQHENSPPCTLHMTVADTGCGISPELRERIFEPFVTTKTEGTGQGLAISTQIVQQYGGKILVDSQVGAGSIFTVVLPGTVNSNGEEAGK